MISVIRINYYATRGMQKQNPKVGTDHLHQTGVNKSTVITTIKVIYMERFSYV